MHNTLTTVANAVHAYKALQPIAKRLQTIYTHQCNGYDYKGMEAKCANLQTKANLICERIGLKCYHQTDPRGASIYIIDETMNDTNYNQGICIY